MPPRLPTPRNHAFVSFAAEDNAQAGRRWADWLAQALEKFEVPASVAGRQTPAGPVPARIGQVGRSQPAEKEISGKQRTTLVESRTLIVICSPAAARSARVTEEVRLFKQFAQGRVLALVVEGEPDADLAPASPVPATPPRAECFPETLRFEVKPDGTVDREWRLRPIAVDLRIEGGPGFTAAGTYQAVLKAGNTLPAAEVEARAADYGARLEEARRTLVAGVLGVPPGDLAAETEEARGARESGKPARARRGFRWAALFIFLLLLVAGGLGWVAYHALEQQVTTQGARERADRLIIYLQRDLHQKLTPAGQFSLAAGANDQIIQYLTTVARDSKDPLIFGALADAQGNAADLLVEQDNLPVAYETALETVRIRKQAMDLPNAPTENGVREIADLRRVAEISQKVGKVGDALSIIEQAQKLAMTLSHDRLGDADVTREMVRANYAAASILQDGGKMEEAARTALMGRDLARKQMVGPPPDLTWQEEVYRGSELLGLMYQKAGNNPTSLTEYREARRVLGEMAARDTLDMALQGRMAKIHLRAGNLLASQQRFEEAAVEVRQALVFSERAARQQAANVEAQFDYLFALRRMAEILLNGEAKGRTEALIFYQRALEYLALRFPGENEGRAGTLKREIELLRDVALRPPAPAAAPAPVVPAPVVPALPPK
jgi:tetratricopeptide (TPR) repeat protein